MRRPFFVAVVWCLLFSLHTTCAELTQDEGLEEVTLYLGRPKIFQVVKPTRVVVGNPDIADVSGVNDNEIILMPKAEGMTTFVYWDAVQGETSYRLRVISEDLSDIKSRLDKILYELDQPNVTTQVFTNENKIILKGEVKTLEEKEQLTALLTKYQDKLIDMVKVKEEETTIDIDVEVIEVDRDATSTLGFTMPGAITLTEPSGQVAFKDFFRFNDWTRSSFTAQLDLLVQEGKAKVLSRPKLSCQSGKEAELLVGGEKPIFSTTVASAGGEGTDIEYKEYGIKLKIKPALAEQDRIKVGLNVEVSEVGEDEIIGSVDAPTAKAFPLTKRTVTTELYLNNGQTLGIGGLVKQKEEVDTRKTALLGDVPIIGAFFRNKVTKIGGGQGQRGNVELLILLTPRIGYVKEKAVAAKAGNAVIETNQSIMVASELGPVSPEVAQYTQLVKRHILSHFSYPEVGRQAGFEGTVKLSLTFSYIGELLNASVLDSSGYSVLDEHALQIVKMLSSYPPFPPTIQQKELTIEIPIEYRLN